MKKLIAIALVALFSVTLAHIDTADAKRFGSGMGFGKQRTISPQMQKKPPYNQQKTADSQRGSARPGFMGAIAGLALGGLLGALFFGGAFEGINLFDILIVGALIYGLMWFFRRKAQGMAYGNAWQAQGGYGQQPQFEQAFGGSGFEQADEPVQQPPSAPVDIDPDHFIGAAKEVFMRLQAAWDAKDVDAIRKFANDEAIRAVEAELAKLGDNTTRTEVGMLDAKILDTWHENGFDLVAVQYNAMLREQLIAPSGEPLSEEQPREIAEIWIFEQRRGTDDPTWYLAGIQQVN